jgi:DNA repair protein RAD5
MIGDMSQKARTRVITNFISNETITVFLMTLKTGAVGLNLVAANHVFIVDPWWNPAVEEQAIERVHRIGQTREVFVSRFVCKGSIEERIIELHKSKTNLINNAMVFNPLERKKQNLEKMRYLLED